MEAGSTLVKMLSGGRSYSGQERNCCFLNTGGDPRSRGRFANVSAATGLDLIDDGRGVAVVDWDHDGDLDVWTSNRTAPRLRLMRNELIGDSANQSNHFVSLRLMGNGQTTNRDAIGARVELIAGGQSEGGTTLRTIQSLRAGEGFLAQSSKWLHFGLGDADQIEKVVVQWPGDGQVAETFMVDAVDCRYELRQGSGQAEKLSSQPRQTKLNPQVPDQLPPQSQARIPFQVLLSAPRLAYLSFDQRRRVKSVRGKPLLLTLWSRTCSPCLEELAELSERADEIRAAGIDVLALSIDGMTDDGDVQAAEQFLTRINFPFTGGLATESLVDGLQKLNDHLMPLHRPLPVPSSFLIDSRGKLSVIYRGRVPFAQLLKDKDHSTGNTLQRFQRSAALPGRMIDSGPVADATLRQAAGVRDLYAKKLSAAGDQAAAADEWAEVIRLKPDYTFGQHIVGQFLSEQGKFNSARNHYLQALKHLPNDVNLHTAMANLYIREGNFDAAREHGEEAIRISPDVAEYHCNLGNILSQQGKFDEAVGYFEAAIKIKPDFAQAIHNLGIIRLQDGDLAQAKQLFHRALTYQSDYAQAHFNLGRIYAQEGNLAQAISHLERAVELQPNHGQARALLRQVMAQVQGQPGG